MSTGSVLTNSIFGSVLQQIVYPTLSNFPAWRSTVPQPIVLEGLQAEREYREQFKLETQEVMVGWSDEDVEESESESDESTQGNTQRKGKMNRKNGKNNGMNGGKKNGKKNDVETDTESGSESEEGEKGNEENDDGEHSDDDSILSIPMKDDVSDWNCDDSDTYVPSVDYLSVSTDKVYDPCFWLPALHFNLMQSPHSVRQLANTGALSLIIVGISSHCSILRSISMSSLQRVLELIKLQTPDRDAGFRERPQLLLLLNFIKNCLDSLSLSTTSDRGSKPGIGSGSGSGPGSGSGCGPIQFPSVISLFLSRAALHLLQPTHELFSKINKYLLSRPFCDLKDVPLYDLMIVDGDAQTEQAQRLTTFRIVRDGLCTRFDHLNLCRKNAYNRLMLLFPVLCKDSRAGHAVFDLLDKALGMQVASRYLLERCSVISWLQQMASATNSLDIDTTRIVIIENDRMKLTGDTNENNSNSNPNEKMNTNNNSNANTNINNNMNTSGEEHDQNDTVNENINDNQKNKTNRNQIIRSQPSIIIAAPPRLLARVLCLLRRALGAVYLLSAGSSSSNSGHLDQIQLGITTIIDVRICINFFIFVNSFLLIHFHSIVHLISFYLFLFYFFLLCLI